MTYEMGGLRRVLQELEAVQKGLNESAAKAAPKPKFAFKRRTAPPPPLPASDNTTPPPPLPSPLGAPRRTATYGDGGGGGGGGGGGVPVNALTLANQSRAYLSRAVLPNRRTSTDPTTPRSQCLALTALSECVVNLLEPTTATEGEDGDGSSGTRPAATSTSPPAYPAIYLSDLRDSLVLLPENARQGSVLVQNCSQCVFVLGGHQVRRHFLSLFAQRAAPSGSLCGHRGN